MALEIERRFWISHLRPGAPEATDLIHIRDGYFNIGKTFFRIRICDNRTAFLAHKEGSGISREEIEPPIELEPAKMLLASCRLQLEKRRLLIAGWEINYFCSPLEGLIFAEKPLNSVNEEILIPEWIVNPVEITELITCRKLARFIYYLKINGYKGKLTQNVLDMIHQQVQTS